MKKFVLYLTIFISLLIVENNKLLVAAASSEAGSRGVAAKVFKAVGIDREEIANMFIKYKPDQQEEESDDDKEIEGAVEKRGVNADKFSLMAASHIDDIALIKEKSITMIRKNSYYMNAPKDDFNGKGEYDENDHRARIEKTALMMAAKPALISVTKHYKAAIVRLLLEYWANVNTSDNKGRTLISILDELGNKAVKEIYEQFKKEAELAIAGSGSAARLAAAAPAAVTPPPAVGAGVGGAAGVGPSGSELAEGIDSDLTMELKKLLLAVAEVDSHWDSNE